MQSKTSPRRKKAPGIIEIVCLVIAVVFVVYLYGAGFVRELMGKDRNTTKAKPAVEIIKGQIQPPLPGATKKDAAEQATGAEEKK